MKKSIKKFVMWLMIDVAQQENNNIKYYTSTFKYCIDGLYNIYIIINPFLARLYGVFVGIVVIIFKKNFNA